jgi:hypothetical protein
LKYVNLVIYPAAYLLFQASAYAQQASSTPSPSPKDLKNSDAKVMKRRKSKPPEPQLKLYGWD